MRLSPRHINDAARIDLPNPLPYARVCAHGEPSVGAVDTVSQTSRSRHSLFILAAISHVTSFTRMCLGIGLVLTGVMRIFCSRTSRSWRFPLAEHRPVKRPRLYHRRPSVRWLLRRGGLPVIRSHVAIQSALLGQPQPPGPLTQRSAPLLMSLPDLGVGQRAQPQRPTRPLTRGPQLTASARTEPRGFGVAAVAMCPSSRLGPPQADRLDRRGS